MTSALELAITKRRHSGRSNSVTGFDTILKALKQVANGEPKPITQVFGAANTQTRKIIEIMTGFGLIQENKVRHVRYISITSKGLRYYKLFTD